LSLLCSAGNTATLQGKTVDYPAKDLGVFDMHTGNPVIPAYLADATMIYDQETDRKCVSDPDVALQSLQKLDNPTVEPAEIVDRCRRYQSIVGTQHNIQSRNKKILPDVWH